MKRRLLFAGLVLLLAVPLVLLLQGFVRQVLVVEILRLFWAVRLLFEGLPQAPLWFFFFLGAGFIALFTLIGRAPSPVAEDEPPLQDPGQVQALARAIRRAGQGSYFRLGLGLQLEQLVWDVLAYHRGTTVQDLRQRFAAGTLDLPEAVADYLWPSQEPGWCRSHPWWQRLLHRLRRGWRGFLPAPGAAQGQASASLQDVVRFLEEQLEVQNGSHSG